MGLLNSIGGVLSRGASSLGNFLNGSGTFANPTFTVAGIKERTANVGNVLKGAFIPGQGGVQVNRNIIKNEAVAKTLQTAASHPYASALIATGGIMAAKRALPAARKLISKRTLGAAATVGGTAPVVSGMLTKNKASEIVKDAVTEMRQEKPLVEQATEAIFSKKDQPEANSLLNSLAGRSGILKGGSHAKKRKKAVRRRRKKTVRRVHGRYKSKHRKLKFGSPAWRKKYLHKRRKGSRRHSRKKQKRSKFVSFTTKDGRKVKFKAR